MNSFTFASGTEVVLTVNGAAVTFSTSHCALQREVRRGGMIQRISLTAETESDPFNLASRRLINDMATELTNGERPKAILGRYRDGIIQVAYGTSEYQPPKLVSDSETIKLLEAKIERLEAEKARLSDEREQTLRLLDRDRLVLLEINKVLTPHGDPVLLDDLPKLARGVVKKRDRLQERLAKATTVFAFPDVYAQFAEHQTEAVKKAMASGGRVASMSPLFAAPYGQPCIWKTRFERLMEELERRAARATSNRREMQQLFSGATPAQKWICTGYVRAHSGLLSWANRMVARTEPKS